MNSPYSLLHNPLAGETREGSLVLFALGRAYRCSVGAGIAYGESGLSLTARGAVLVVAVAWAGRGCLINGRSCGGSTAE